MPAPVLCSVLMALAGTVVGDGGKPVAGARVTAVSRGDERTVPIVLRGETDARGAWALAGAPPSTYALWVEAPGFAPGLSADVKSSSPGRRVVLEGGHPVTGSVFDAGTRRLVPGARVEAWWRGVPDEPVARATADASGRYQLRLAAGDYLIVARAPDRCPETRPLSVGATAPAPVALALSPGRRLSVAVTDGTKPIEGVRVRLWSERDREQIPFFVGRTGPDGGIEIDGAPETSRFVADADRDGYGALVKEVVVSSPRKGKPEILRLSLHRGTFVSGRVTGPEGVGIGGARVSVSAPLGDATTAGDGTFRVAGVPAGDYTLSVAAEGYRDAEDRPIRVPASGLAGLQIRLDPGHVLSGLVHDEGGQPVASAEVAASGVGGWGSAMTDEGGAFRIGGLGEREVRLTVKAEGFQRSQTTLAPNTATCRVVLRRGASIAGHATDEASGQPLPGAVVVAAKAAAGGGFVMDELEHVEGRTEDGGAFVLGGLGPGRWTVMAMARGYGSAPPIEVELLERQQREGVVLRLPRGGAIAGVVVDEASDAPIAGAHVTATSPDAWHTSVDAVSDGAGRFRLDGIGGGIASVTARRSGYVERTIQGVAVGDQEKTSTLTLELSRGGTVRGTVSHGGAPVKGADARAGDRRGRTDGAGVFELTDLPGPVAALEVSANIPEQDIVRVVRRDVAVTPGTVTEVAVDVGGGASVVGRITAGGAPFGGGSVMLYGSWGRTALVSLGADGRFAFADVPQGEATLALDPASGSTVRRPVDIAGTEVTLEIDLGGGSLAGFLRSREGGEPVRNGSVRLEGVSETWSDASGAFSFPLVPAGTFRLSAGARGFQRVEREVSLAEGQRISDLVLELPQTGEERRITGQVVDAAGTPVAFAVVFSVSPDGRTGGGEGYSDVAGAFTLQVPEGAFELMAVHPAHGPARQSGASAGAEGITLRLARPAELRVVVSRDQKPAPGAKVRLTLAGWPQHYMLASLLEGVTDSSGVSILGALPAGAATVEVVAGTLSRSVPVTLVTGERVEVAVGF